MIVPSIDLQDGKAVQLVGGEKLALEAGDPAPIAERFALVGEVAVVDLDAALGRGSNAAVIEPLLRIAPCRVGGGIRDAQTARSWLDRGAIKVVLGTAAVPEVLQELPRERTIAALDARHGEVVVKGWTEGTGRTVLERIKELRERLANLSWFMRCLVEPIARAANREDICKGRFWEGRFKCQALLDEDAVLAAIAYVDLNPVRAKICDTLAASAHTSARVRLTEIEQESAASARPLAPIAGIRGLSVLQMTQGEYLSLVDYTGRQIRADKRGAIEGTPPAVLVRLGYRPETWTRQVLAVKSDYSRAMGEVESLIEKAAAMGQSWLRGIATARWLAAQVAVAVDAD